jgi:hypothetical protein
MDITISIEKAGSILAMAATVGYWLQGLRNDKLRIEKLERRLAEVRRYLHHTGAKFNTAELPAVEEDSGG